MKVAVFSTQSYDKEFLRAAHSNHELIFFEAPLNKNTVNLTQGFESVCVFVNDDLSAPVIESLHQNGVKFIALRCAGFNNVDLDATKKCGIKVARVPAYSPHGVAEHAVALILTLDRKTHKAYNRIRENNFSLERLTGFNLYEKTVGVIGTGKIGEAFCHIMNGFGCKLLAYDLKENEEVKKLGAKYTSIDNILKYSDIISLHCPLTPETKHLINKQSFEKMKDGSMLINTSRGALIDTKEAINALKHGKLGYLGLDVYEQESKFFYKDLSEEINRDDLITRLMTFPNVLITSHQGFFTKEALSEISKITLQNISDFEVGKINGNEVK